MGTAAFVRSSVLILISLRLLQNRIVFSQEEEVQIISFSSTAISMGLFPVMVQETGTVNPMHSLAWMVGSVSQAPLDLQQEH